MTASPTRAKPRAKPTGPASVDAAEVAKFAALARDWWDPEGPMRPLHRLNPTRLAYVRDRLLVRTNAGAKARQPLKGLRVLDIGCGAGLLTEPLTRMGAETVGADATADSIAVAREHAASVGLAIDYRVSTAEELAAAGERFDAVVAMEIIEHVTQVDDFVASLATLLAPGGTLLLSTLNRTPKSFAMAIVGAEYLLRWLPPGTHNWRKFVRPSELARALRHAGLHLDEVVGVSYQPLTDGWALSRDTGVNYMAAASKPE